MYLEVERLCFSYGPRPVLRGVDFSAEGGELIALLGPNGAGKSTLMRCLLGLLNGYECHIRIGGRDLREMSRAALAREVAYVPQSAPPVFNYTVLETVLMGATGSVGMLRTPGTAQEEQAMAILEGLDIGRLARRGCGELSGGERQLTLLARALLQNAHILVMDEPTANLDYGNQNRVMERVSALAERGYIVLFSTHDPNQAILYAHRALTLWEGRILTNGPPEQALTGEILERLYGIPVRRIRMAGGGMVCLPRRAACGEEAEETYGEGD